MNKEGLRYTISSKMKDFVSQILQNKGSKTVETKVVELDTVRVEFLKDLIVQTYDKNGEPIKNEHI